MAFPTPITTNVYKITLFFGGGGQGWTENIYFAPGNAAPGTTEQSVVEDAAAKLATAVSKGMSGRYTIKAGRYVLVAVAGVAQTGAGQGRLVKSPSFPTVGTLSTTGVDAPWTDVFFDFYDASNSVRRVWTQSGVLVNWTKFDADGTIIPNTNIQSLTAFRDSLKGFLTTGTGGPTFANGVWAMRYRVKDPAVNPLYNVKGIELTTDGRYFKYIVQLQNPNATPTAWAVGQQITIRGIRLKCIKKVSGQAYISDVAANTPVAGQTTITTSKLNCCGALPVINPQPNWIAQKSDYKFVAIFDSILAGAGPHKRGKSTGQRAGRRSKACC